MTARRSRIAVGIGAVLVGALCLWRDRHGVRLTSDGWPGDAGRVTPPPRPPDPDPARDLSGDG